MAASRMAQTCLDVLATIGDAGREQSLSGIFEYIVLNAGATWEERTSTLVEVRAHKQGELTLTQSETTSSARGRQQQVRKVMNLQAIIGLLDYAILLQQRASLPKLADSSRLPTPPPPATLSDLGDPIINAQFVGHVQSMNYAAASSARNRQPVASLSGRDYALTMMGFDGLLNMGARLALDHSQATDSHYAEFSKMDREIEYQKSCRHCLGGPPVQFADTVSPFVEAFQRKRQIFMCPDCAALFTHVGEEGLKGVVTCEELRQKEVMVLPLLSKIEEQESYYGVPVLSPRAGSPTGTLASPFNVQGLKLEAHFNAGVEEMEKFQNEVVPIKVGDEDRHVVVLASLIRVVTGKSDAECLAVFGVRPYLAVYDDSFPEGSAVELVRVQPMAGAYSCRGVILSLQVEQHLGGMVYTGTYSLTNALDKGTQIAPDFPHSNAVGITQALLGSAGVQPGSFVIGKLETEYADLVSEFNQTIGTLSTLEKQRQRVAVTGSASVPESLQSLWMRLVTLWSQTEASPLRFHCVPMRKGPSTSMWWEEDDKIVCSLLPCKTSGESVVEDCPGFVCPVPPDRAAMFPLPGVSYGPDDDLSDAFRDASLAIFTLLTTDASSVDTQSGILPGLDRSSSLDWQKQLVIPDKGGGILYRVKPLAGGPPTAARVRHIFERVSPTAGTYETAEVEEVVQVAVASAPMNTGQVKVTVSLNKNTSHFSHIESHYDSDDSDDETRAPGPLEISLNAGRHPLAIGQGLKDTPEQRKVRPSYKEFDAYLKSVIEDVNKHPQADRSQMFLNAYNSLVWALLLRQFWKVASGYSRPDLMTRDAETFAGVAGFCGRRLTESRFAKDNSMRATVIAREASKQAADEKAAKAMNEFSQDIASEITLSDLHAFMAYGLSCSLE